MEELPGWLQGKSMRMVVVPQEFGMRPFRHPARAPLAAPRAAPEKQRRNVVRSYLRNQAIPPVPLLIEYHGRLLTSASIPKSTSEESAF